MLSSLEVWLFVSRIKCPIFFVNPIRFNSNFILPNKINSSRTGSLRPTSGPGYGKRSRANGLEHKRKPPRGIYINHDDIVSLACPEQANRSDDLLASMDREINALLTQVCKIIKH